MWYICVHGLGRTFIKYEIVLEAKVTFWQRTLKCISGLQTKFMKSKNNFVLTGSHTFQDNNIFFSGSLTYYHVLKCGFRIGPCLVLSDSSLLIEFRIFILGKGSRQTPIIRQISPPIWENGHFAPFSPFSQTIQSIQQTFPEVDLYTWYVLILKLNFEIRKWFFFFFFIMNSELSAGSIACKASMQFPNC